MMMMMLIKHLIIKLSGPRTGLANIFKANTQISVNFGEILRRVGAWVY